MSKTSYPVPVMEREIEQYLSECHESDLKDERDALAAKLDAVRAWIDRRGVNVDDRDDEYMRGYRDAQRHARLDALELLRALDGDCHE